MKGCTLPSCCCSRRSRLHAAAAHPAAAHACRRRASLASTCRTLRSSSKAASISWYTAGQGEPLEVNVCSPEKVASFLRLLQSYRGIGAGLLHTPLVLRVYDVEKESYNAIEFEDGIDDLPVGADVAATMIPAIFDELAAMQLRELEYYSRLPFDCGLLNSPDFGSLRSLDMLLDNDILCVWCVVWRLVVAAAVGAGVAAGCGDGCGGRCGGWLRRWVWRRWGGALAG